VTQQLQNGQRMNVIQFLEDNDISVTKFLEWLGDAAHDQENVLMIEFLETHYPAYWHHGGPGPDAHLSTYHPTHSELDHHYDDQRDIEPVHYHEHAVHRAFPSADAHSYRHHDAYYDNSEVTAHHVRSEETSYEHSHGDHTMNPHYLDPVSHTDAHHHPVYTETHDTHHHEAPRYDHY